MPWVKKLLVSLAKADPHEDRDEAERRSELTKSIMSWISHLLETDPLCRSLEDIGARSLALSEKGKVARILDKAQDTGEVVKLIERLRRAILIYQVSVKHHRNRESLTCGTDVTTTVAISPGLPIDREPPSLEFDFETDLCPVDPVIFRCILETASGKNALTHQQTPNNHIYRTRQLKKR